jgi:hypothetical protein
VGLRWNCAYIEVIAWATATIAGKLTNSALELVRFRTGNDRIPHWIWFVSALDLICFRTGNDPNPPWNLIDESFYLESAGKAGSATVKKKGNSVKKSNKKYGVDSDFYNFL